MAGLPVIGWLVRLLVLAIGFGGLVLERRDHFPRWHADEAAVAH